MAANSSHMIADESRLDVARVREAPDSHET